MTEAELYDVQENWLRVARLARERGVSIEEAVKLWVAGERPAPPRSSEPPPSG